MKTTIFIFLGLLAATSVLAQKPNEASKPREIPPNGTGGHLSLEDFQALASNPADYRISYGKDENQFGDFDFIASHVDNPNLFSQSNASTTMTGISKINIKGNVRATIGRPASASRNRACGIVLSGRSIKY
ncbi:MAG TPA: hypothetical protein VJ255_06750 [Candidatus Acidoferrum sp.]|nr:hypothetical protein [Candidatus Acidoferrum sp.]